MKSLLSSLNVEFTITSQIVKTIYLPMMGETPTPIELVGLL